MTSTLTAAAAGFGTGLSLIVAIGAQNAFVLRQGIRRDAVLGARTAVVGGGLLVVLTMLVLAATMPTLRRYSGGA